MQATRTSLATLTAQERLALGILALAEEPLSWHVLSAILGQAPANRWDNRRLKYKKIPLTQGLFAGLARRDLVRLEGDALSCPPEYAQEARAELTTHPDFRAIAAQVISELPSADPYERNHETRLGRDFRLSIELDEVKLFQLATRSLTFQRLEAWLNAIDAAALAQKSPELLCRVLHLALTQSLLNFTPLGGFEATLMAGVKRGLDLVIRQAVQYLVLQGRREEARRLAHPEIPETLAWLALGEGDYEACAAHFEAGLKRQRALQDNKWTYSDFSGVAYLWTCLATGREKAGYRYARLAEEVTNHHISALRCLLSPAAEDRRALRQRLEDVPGYLVGIHSLELGLLQAWRAPELAERYLPWLEKNVEAARAAGYAWVAEQLEAIPLRRPGTLVTLVASELPWEQHLTALVKWGAAPEVKTGEFRLVWEVHPDAPPEAREQKRKGQTWGVGKKIPLTRLLKEPPDYLTAHDRRILAHLRKEAFDRKATFTARVFLDMVDHPLVMHDGEPVRVVRAEPRLKLAGLKLELEPKYCGEVEIDFSHPGEVRVYEMGASVRALYDLMGAGLVFPAEARARLLETLQGLAGQIAVEADLGEGEARAADATPCLLLSPHGEGLQVQVRCRPLGAGGPLVRPGLGSRDCFGEKHTARRDLALEGERCRELLAACPTLAEATEWNWDFSLPDLTASLQLLEELGPLLGQVVLEWPQGQPWTLRPQAATGQLTMTVKSAKGWFELQGQLAVDAGRVLSLRELLDLVADSQGRFLRLGPREFLSLTNDLRRRLDDLSRLAERSGQKLQLHPLAGAPVEALAEEGARLEADDSWKDNLRRLQGEEVPAVPTTLQAELREYQQEGYRWLARLARAGVGGCLADDMGLGKTVQALALLLDRGGPSLVVCPTSVCFNWLEEARRFAPSLNLATLGRNRAAQVAALGAGDVLVVSYGLLNTCQELLEKVAWEVVILDEAQLVKNARAKRAQAASALQARARIALTGTPVENHLGDIWSLFRFLNPGLLGGEKSFAQRFARPIEEGNRAAAHCLKRLISPFVLRRLKSQVLDELPPRTEIPFYVELEAEERALYEAARQRASESLAQRSSDEPEAFHVLAELTRLRRLCCHPRLVMPDSPLPGAKLQAVLQLVEELRENRHRALVFSQFVDHLGLLRAELDARGIPYRYLDGSTPAAARPDLVREFQSGQGDLFLISLKAGGSGLNLTAADYVIHLDPWWNPAVEDQASDRAHRLGQQRPVTVYRMIARDTVEERIVDLHRHKRALADQLLSGQDGSSRLNVDELLALLGGTGPGPA